MYTERALGYVLLIASAVGLWVLFTYLARSMGRFPAWCIACATMFVCLAVVSTLLAWVLDTLH
jgi:hypothetical protein